MVPVTQSKLEERSLSNESKRSMKEQRIKQELEKLLARTLSEENVRASLSQWPQCVDASSFIPNPHAHSGPLFDRFLARLIEHRREIKARRTFASRLGRCFTPNHSAEHYDLSRLRFVFHGTPAANLESILQNGLLPDLRRSNKECDWFAHAPDKAKRFRLDSCPGIHVTYSRLLVFLVLPVEESVHYDGSGVLTMKCATYQLPVGTVEYLQN